MVDLKKWFRKQRLARISAIVNAIHREAFMRLAGHEMKSEYAALRRELRHSIDFLSSTNPIARQIQEAIEAIEKLERENKRLTDLAGKVRRYDMGERVTVEYRDEGKWAVVCCGAVYSRDGKWVHEPLPSDRSQEFMDSTRYPLDEACFRAQVIVEEMRHAASL